MSRSERSSVNEVADQVFMLGSEHVHWYAVLDGTSITVVDTGMSRYWPQLETLLSSIGRSLTDIEAVLLTHADPDHLGNAERIAVQTGAQVFVHQADVPGATKQVRITPPRLPMWRPSVLSFFVHGIRQGLLSWQPVSSPVAVDAGGRLEVPGRPTVIHIPGHTPGSLCYAFDDPDVVFVGDALLNKDPVTGRSGPTVNSAINANHRQALESLTSLEDIDQRTVLYGHGEPSHGGIRHAVRTVTGI